MFQVKTLLKKRIVLSFILILFVISSTELFAGSRQCRLIRTNNIDDFYYSLQWKSSDPSITPARLNAFRKHMNKRIETRARKLFKRIHLKKKDEHLPDNVHFFLEFKVNHYLLGDTPVFHHSLSYHRRAKYGSFQKEAFPVIYELGRTDKTPERSEYSAAGANIIELLEAFLSNFDVCNHEIYQRRYEKQLQEEYEKEFGTVFSTFYHKMTTARREN